MYTKSIAIQALLSSQVSAVMFRPIAGSVPWHLAVTTPEFENPGHPVNYVVPDFGVDQDIKNVSGAIAQSEKKLKKTLKASFGATASTVATPRDYVVADYGVDTDILRTKGSIKQSEGALGHEFKANFGQTASNVATPRNYVVPDFGVDTGILNVQNSIKVAEKKLGKKMSASFGQTASNVATPRNYVVPSFGVDRDITWTANSIKEAEKSLKHEWKPTKTNGFWQKMPAVDANSSYTQSNSTGEDSKATKTNGSTAFKAVAQTSDPTTDYYDVTEKRPLYIANALEAPIIDGSDVQLFSESGEEIRFIDEVGQGSDYVNDVSSSNLSLREKGALPPKMVPVADLVINPQRAYSADAPSNAEMTQFIDQEAQGDAYIEDVMGSNLSFIERGGVPPKSVPVADLIINPQRGYSASASSNAAFEE